MFLKSAVMKNIKLYMALFVTLFMSVMLTGCKDDASSSGESGLSVKVFAPTRVMPGQKVVITGTGLADVTSVNFGSAQATNIRMISPNDIEVTAPAGLPAEGGELTVNTASGSATASEAFTVGSPRPRSFDPADEVGPGELLKIVGSDMQFIEKVLFLDEDGNDIEVKALDFVRKAEASVQVKVPKGVAEGEGTVRVVAVDGSVITVPAIISFKAGGGGHWETQRISIWKNDGSAGAISWSSAYRFALEGHDGAHECIAEFPQEIWDKLKTTTFYMDIEATNPQVRVTNGWWNPEWNNGDIQPGSDLLTDNGDGTFTVEINISGDADLVASLDERHLLFTGDRYTPIEIYFTEESWIDNGGGGGGESQMEVFWENDGSGGEVSWNGIYRFALEGHDGANECIAELPQDVWDKLKTSTFYIDVEGANPQIRVTNGWWDPEWVNGDIQPGSDLLTDNGDGTFTAEINISGDGALVESLDVRHLLFTGSGYKLLKIYIK